MANELYIRCVTDAPAGSLRIKTVNIPDVTPYAACDKDESLLSILKRCIVQDTDGKPILQIHIKT